MEARELLARDRADMLAPAFALVALLASAVTHVADPVAELGDVGWSGVEIAVDWLFAPPKAGVPTKLPKRKQLGELIAASTVKHGDLPTGECDYDDPPDATIGADVQSLLKDKMRAVSGGCTTKAGVTHCDVGFGKDSEPYMVYEFDLTATGEIVPRSISCYIND